MFVFFAILYGIWWGFLRRAFGGWLENSSILGNRGVQCALMILSLIPVFAQYDFSSVGIWIFSIAVSVYLYACFWSKGHGPCFDMGRHGTPTKELIKRYEELPGYDFVISTTPIENWYGYLFDFRLMRIRYFTPMILMCLVNPMFLFIGYLIAPIYAHGWTVEKEDKWAFNEMGSFLSSGTNLGEVVSGFVFGFGTYIIMYLTENNLLLEMIKRGF